MKNLLIATLLCGWLSVNLAIQLSAQEPAQSAAPKPPGKEKPAEAETPVKPEFLIHVVDSSGNPIAGAKVTPSAYMIQNVRAMGGSIEGDDAAPATSDADGEARIVFKNDEKHLHKKPLADLLKFGFQRLILHIEHPDYPTIDTYFDPIGPGMVTLPDAQTVEIRAHRAGENVPLHHLFPVLKAPATFWSESPEGLVTIRRVDLTSPLPSRFLRTVHIPDEGPAWFSDVFDLLPQKRPIAIEAELKRGIRVEGRLADDVPRPIKDGRVVARIVDTATGGINDSYWVAAADIVADGTFVFESLPPNGVLQVTAICNGWVSRNPTDDVITDYWKQVYGAPLGPRRFKMGIVFPQVFRLEGDSIKATIPMTRTATYEVNVLDENDRPIPGARVGYSPNVLFYGSGNMLLGVGVDRLTQIRTELRAGMHQDSSVDKEHTEQLHEWTGKYFRTTDAHGIAVIPNLPCGSDEGPTGGQDVSFWVQHDGYLVTANPPAADFPPEDQPSKVHLNPGQTSHVTVHMHKAPEKTN
jgi:hypothetical protein